MRNIWVRMGVQREDFKGAIRALDGAFCPRIMEQTYRRGKDCSLVHSLGCSYANHA